MRLLRKTTMSTVNPWGARLTDKELMSAVITCVMSGKQSDRDDACRLLQGHIRAVEHHASGSYALGREDGLREAAHICQDMMTNGVRKYERANPGGKPIALTHLAQADDCLAAISAVMSEPNVGFTGPTCEP